MTFQQHFDDGSTTKTILGVGTYTVAPDGTVTFKPEPEFTGTAPSVTVVREDMNGTKASATYTPTVTPVTTFVDKEGKAIPGYPTEDGENPKKDIPGYRFVETKKFTKTVTQNMSTKRSQQLTLTRMETQFQDIQLRMENNQERYSRL